MRSIVLMPKIKVYQTGSFGQTITGGTTNIAFNRFEREDIHNMWDGAIFTNKTLLVKEFMVSGAIYFANATNYNVGFWKNNVWHRRTGSQTQYNEPFMSRILLGPTDYFSVRAEQSGSIQNYATEGKRHYISIIEI